MNPAAILAQAERWTDPTTEGATELEDAKRFLSDLLSDWSLPITTLLALQATISGE